MTLEAVASAPSIRKRFGRAIEDGYRSGLDASADVPEIFAAAGGYGFARGSERLDGNTMTEHVAHSQIG